MPTRTRQQWDQRYQEGFTPWDTRITPPEVKAFWQSGRLPHTGRALDLGCGPGTNIAYLASLGLFAIGIDFASLALARAKSRISVQRDIIHSRIALIHADVTALPFQEIVASYILDIGCLHVLPRVLRPNYAAGVINNLAHAGYYHLFAFDHPQTPADANSESSTSEHGVGENEVATLFAPNLTVVDVIRGNPDHKPCRWYLLQKTHPQ